MAKSNHVYRFQSKQKFGLAFVRLLSILSFILLSMTLAYGQEGDGMPDDVAPPPLKLISKEEKDQLAAESGVKDRANLYIDMMEARLKKSEDLSSHDDFGSALTQLGSYEGLLEKMVSDLESENKSGKALSGFKKLEITLRQHMFRIETLRRLMPFKYGFHLTRLQRVIRRTRAEATESLFSDSVVRIPEENAGKKAEQKPE
jgi:hypothetical protein